MSVHPLLPWLVLLQMLFGLRDILASRRIACFMCDDGVAL
jgi:hypothetical protein